MDLDSYKKNFFLMFYRNIRTIKYVSVDTCLKHLNLRFLNFNLKLNTLILYNCILCFKHSITSTFFYYS